MRIKELVSEGEDTRTFMVKQCYLLTLDVSGEKAIITNGKKYAEDWDTATLSDYLGKEVVIE